MSDVSLVVTTLIGGAWDLFQTRVPGFQFSYADIIVGMMLVSTGFALLGFFFGHSGFGSKGKTTQNPKISEERKNDSK